MVVGGLSAENDAELVDLSGSFKQCPFVPNLQAVSQESVGSFVNGAALVCGGTNDNGSPAETCYTYDNEAFYTVILVIPS